MRKTIIMAMAVLMMFGATACGSKDETDVVTTTGVATTTTANNGVVTTKGPNGETDATTTTAETTTAQTQAPKYTTTEVITDKDGGTVLAKTDDIELNTVVYDENGVKVTFNKYETVGDPNFDSLSATFDITVENSTDEFYDVSRGDVEINGEGVSTVLGKVFTAKSNATTNDTIYVYGGSILDWTGFNLNDIETIDFDLDVESYETDIVKTVHCQLNRTTGVMTFEEVVDEE